MSRLGAALGSGMGVIAGVALGSWAKTQARGRGPSTLRDNAQAIGAVTGGVIGAAVGVGCSAAPKQVGTSGVDMYLGSNGAFP